MTIDEALRQRASAGHEFRLSVFPTTDGRYQASVQNGRNSFGLGIRHDPVDALKMALGILRDQPRDDEGAFG